MNCKCKKCKNSFQTEAPSRIANPFCASCLAIEKEQKIKEPAGLPPDFAKVQAELRKEFGKCPKCPAPLIPLQSFKVDGVWHCEKCYATMMEDGRKSEAPYLGRTILTLVSFKRFDEMKKEAKYSVYEINEESGYIKLQESRTKDIQAVTS